MTTKLAQKQKQSRKNNWMSEAGVGQYIFIQTTIVEDLPSYTVWFKVKNHSFCVTPKPLNEKADAERVVQTLTKALTFMVEEQIP